MLDLTRAFIYPFEDKRWLEKLGIMAVIAAAAFVLTPLLIGLIGWAALLGYQAEIMRGWRTGKPVPLPTWDRFGALINIGFYPLLALILYQIPNIILSLVFLVLNQNLGAGVVGGSLLFLLCCGMTPFVLAYNLIALPMLGLAMGKYATDRRFGVFIEIGVLLVALRDHLRAALLYFVLASVSYIALAILGSFTFGILSAVLGVTVFAALNADMAGMTMGRDSLPPSRQIR